MKIGIHAAIVERLELGAEEARDLGWILSQHVNRYAYQKALTVEVAVRLDLEGKPAGEVTPEQREMAAKKLERMKAKLKAKAAKARGGK
jgi:sRNA-binding protein